MPQNSEASSRIHQLTTIQPQRESADQCRTVFSGSRWTWSRGRPERLPSGTNIELHW